MADSSANGGTFDGFKGNAQAAYDQLANGPVAQNVKDQGAKTSSEFSRLANSRQTPAHSTATDQPLTHYHNFFSELLSWNNPRASTIAYVSIVSLIFVTRYLDILRYTLKLTWMVLGVTVLAEVAGKAVLNKGLTTQVRPRKYYTLPRETLDALIGDVHELVNFFIIEAQRVLFAENLPISAAAAVGAFFSYYLVKIVPYWGLALLTTTVVFFVPLIYATNQELIDHYVKEVSDIINSQSEQLRKVASKHTAQAAELSKQYVGDYTAKAQQLIRGRSTSPEVTSKPAPKATDFPATPKEGFKNKAESDEESEDESEDEAPAKEPLLA